MSINPDENITLDWLGCLNKACNYQVENENAKCRYCGFIGNEEIGDTGRPDRPWHGLFFDQIQAMSLEERQKHLQYCQYRGCAFPERRRFSYYPTETILYQEPNYHENRSYGYSQTTQNLVNSQKPLRQYHSQSTTGAYQYPQPNISRYEPDMAPQQMPLPYTMPQQMPPPHMMPQHTLLLRIVVQQIPIAPPPPQQAQSQVQPTPD